MTTLQAYLRNGGTLQSLKKDYHLKIKKHQSYPNLYLFKYNQIESPFEEKIVQEARGLILDQLDNWRIISYPYDKFFNYGEKCAADVDWTTSLVYEKLDGSLMTLYYYDGKWMVSSSGMPDASGSVHDLGFSFADLFWQIWNELGYQYPEETDKCFMFELLSPLAQIVVPQNKNRLVLHGVRSLATYQEEKPNNYPYEIVTTFNFGNFNDCLLFARKLPVNDGEGVIVCDQSFNRCKIKSEMYLNFVYAFSRRKFKINPLKILHIIQLNETEEFLSVYPQWREECGQLWDKYEKIIEEIELIFKSLNPNADPRTFAQSISHLWYRDCLFKLKKQTITSVKEWLSQYNTKLLLEIIKA